MTSLEGSCAPARADSDAPAGLTFLHREAPSSTLAWGPRRARRATAVRFAVFLLRSPEARRSHDAAASTLPPLTFDLRQSCTPRVGPCSRGRDSGAGGYMARRHLLAEHFEPLRVQLAQLEDSALASNLAEPVRPPTVTGWPGVDEEIRELRRSFRSAATAQDYRAIGTHCVGVLEKLSARPCTPPAALARRRN
jgi:hypothetical protein